MILHQMQREKKTVIRDDVVINTVYHKRAYTQNKTEAGGEKNEKEAGSLLKAMRKANDQ